MIAVTVPLTCWQLLLSVHGGVKGEAWNLEAGHQTLHSPVPSLSCEPRKDPPSLSPDPRFFQESRQGPAREPS